MIATGSADGMLSLFYGWSETSARAYLDTIMTSDEMDALVAVKGARSKCARGKLRDLPQVPVLDRRLPGSAS